MAKAIILHGFNHKFHDYVSLFNGNLRMYLKICRIGIYLDELQEKK